MIADEILGESCAVIAMLQVAAMIGINTELKEKVRDRHKLDALVVLMREKCGPIANIHGAWKAVCQLDARLAKCTNTVLADMSQETLQVPPMNPNVANLVFATEGRRNVGWEEFTLPQRGDEQDTPVLYIRLEGGHYVALYEERAGKWVKVGDGEDPVKKEQETKEDWKIGTFQVALYMPQGGVGLGRQKNTSRGTDDRQERAPADAPAPASSQQEQQPRRGASMPPQRDKKSTQDGAREQAGAVPADAEEDEPPDDTAGRQAAPPLPRPPAEPPPRRHFDMGNSAR
jgi:hypothetical protein